MSRWTAFLVFVGISLVRAALLGVFDLMPQSAYYSTYAEHLALSYYDHPPMIGWLLFAWFSLLGKSALTLRLATFVTTLATQLAFHGLAGELLGNGDRKLPGPRYRALAVFSTTGMATLLSFIAVPDVPLLLFWTLALWVLWRILFRGRANLWPIAGLAMGLALLSKYTAVYLQGGLVLFLLASPGHRRHLKTAGPWAALALAHLVALPIYVWNARHGWVSFSYQFAGRAAEVSGIQLNDALGFLASQAGVLLPIPLFVFLWVVGRDTWHAIRSPLRMDRITPERLFLLCFSVPVFATCIGLSTVTWVKSNWPMPAYVAATLLVALSIGQRATRWHLATTGLLHAALAVQLIWYPLAVKSDDTWYGWRDLARQVEKRVTEHPGAFVFSADHYKTTAELRFYSTAEVYGMNVLGWNALHYEYIGEDVGALRGRDALFLRSEARLRPSRETARYLERIRLYFGDVHELEPIEIRRRGERVRFFRVFLCTAYRGRTGGTISLP